jgi:monothiol glutaredoxin
MESQIISEQEIAEALDKAISENRVMLFMKGTPERPMCGFSMRVTQALRDVDADFSAMDILPDPRIRQVLSARSGWPTIPQLFVDGELVGGCDITMELHETGELAKIVKSPE